MIKYKYEGKKYKFNITVNVEHKVQIIDLYNGFKKVGSQMRADWVKIDNNLFEDMIRSYLVKKENNPWAY